MDETKHSFAWTALWMVPSFLIGYLWVAPAILPSDSTDVGRATGYAVVEQYDTSWVTTDPSWNPLVDGCLHDCGAP